MNTAHFLALADAWGMHGDVGAGWMVAMMAVMVLFWGAIIFGVIWLIRGAFAGRPGPEQEGRESPSDVLDRRFAEGAISVEDYRERRQVLVNGSTEPKDPPAGDLAAPQAGESR